MYGLAWPVHATGQQPTTGACWRAGCGVSGRRLPARGHLRSAGEAGGRRRAAAADLPGPGGLPQAQRGAARQHRRQRCRRRAAGRQQGKHPLWCCNAAARCCVSQAASASTLRCSSTGASQTCCQAALHAPAPQSSQACAGSLSPCRLIWCHSPAHKCNGTLQLWAQSRIVHLPASTHVKAGMAPAASSVGGPQERMQRTQQAAAHTPTDPCVCAGAACAAAGPAACQAWRLWRCGRRAVCAGHTQVWGGRDCCHARAAAGPPSGSFSAGTALCVGPQTERRVQDVCEGPGRLPRPGLFRQCASHTQPNKAACGAAVSQLCQHGRAASSWLRISCSSGAGPSQPVPSASASPQSCVTSRMACLGQHQARQATCSGPDAPAPCSAPEMHGPGCSWLASGVSARAPAMRMA